MKSMIEIHKVHPTFSTMHRALRRLYLALPGCCLVLYGVKGNLSEERRSRDGHSVIACDILLYYEMIWMSHF